MRFNRKQTIRTSMTLVPYNKLPGAIIGDGHRKRTPFLFLEQIAPSTAAHVRTCCEDFRGCHAGKMAYEIPEIVLCFSVLAHNSTPLWLLEFA